MTSAELAWVAGVFEGEGSISFVGKQGVNVKVSMTDEDVIRRLHAITGVGHVGGPYAGTNKPRWSWHVGNKHQARALLLALRPWLGERRGERADAALERTALPRTRALKQVRHGTTAGYQMERKRGLEHCGACLAANAEKSASDRAMSLV